MKLFRTIPFILLMLTAVTAEAQSALRAAPSTRGISEVVLAAPQQPGAVAPTPAPPPTVIRLDYGQPHLRGRALHTDSLVPYDKSWRLGANASTTLRTDVDLELGGTTIPKGSYVLYTVPGRTSWMLMVERNVGQNPGQYSDSNNVARIPLRHTPLTTPLESFTMWLIPSTEAGPARGELRFAWGPDQLSTTWSVR